MSIVHRLGVGLPTRLLTVQRPTTLRALPGVYRGISLTVPRHAEALERPTRLDGAEASKTPSLRPTGSGAPDVDVNPYKGGPSAIDKAVHFFFLTEILRGGVHSLCWLARLTAGQGCGSCWRTFSGRLTRSCILTKKDRCPPAFAVSMRCGDTPTGRNAV